MVPDDKYNFKIHSLRANQDTHKTQLTQPSMYTHNFEPKQQGRCNQS